MTILPNNIPEMSTEIMVSQCELGSLLPCDAADDLAPLLRNVDEDKSLRSFTRPSRSLQIVRGRMMR